MPSAFRGGEGLGFIDWELAHVGDPARELVRAEGQRFGAGKSPAPDHLVDALHRGYRDRAGALPSGFDARRPVYEAVRLLGKSGFFDIWVEFVDESRDALAAFAAAEMERRLATVS